MFLGCQNISQSIESCHKTSVLRGDSVSFLFQCLSNSKHQYHFSETISTWKLFLYVCHNNLTGKINVWWSSTDVRMDPLCFLRGHGKSWLDQVILRFMCTSCYLCCTYIYLCYILSLYGAHFTLLFFLVVSASIINYLNRWIIIITIILIPPTFKNIPFFTILPQHSSVTLLRLRKLRDSSAILATLKIFDSHWNDLLCKT